MVKVEGAAAIRRPEPHRFDLALRLGPEALSAPYRRAAAAHCFGIFRAAGSKNSASPQLGAREHVCCTQTVPAKAAAARIPAPGG